MSYRFDSPLFLWLLLLLPLLALRGPQQLAGLRYADVGLVQFTTPSWPMRLRQLPTALRWLALALLIIGLARPQQGNARQLINGEGVDIALALDISSSMETPDFFPRNRLEAAKLVIEAFVAERPFDRLGLVVFAQDAFVQGPLTTDHDVLLRLLDFVDSARRIGLEDGTAIGMGLATAVNMLKDSQAKSKVVILLTDGVNNAGQIAPVTAAEAARALGITVYTIGVGRVDSVVIGQSSPLDEATLQEIAAISNGRYFRGEDTEGLRQIYAEINQLETSEIDVRVFTRYQELAGWLLWPGLTLLLLEFALRQTLLRQLP